MKSRSRQLEDLVSDLGDLCTFEAEAEPYPEIGCSAELRRAQRSVADATDAVAQAAAHDEDGALSLQAWVAVGKAQEAVTSARTLLRSIRAVRDRVELAASAARASAERAREEPWPADAQRISVGPVVWESSVAVACAACGRRSRVSFRVATPAAIVAQTLRCPGPGCGGYVVVGCPVSAVSFRVELVEGV